MIDNGITLEALFCIVTKILFQGVSFLSMGNTNEPLYSFPWERAGIQSLPHYKGSIQIPASTLINPHIFFDGLDVEKWPLSLNIGNKVPFRKGPRLGFQHTMCSPQACYLKDACIFNVDLKATEKTLFILNSI